MAKTTLRSVLPHIETLYLASRAALAIGLIAWVVFGRIPDSGNLAIIILAGLLLLQTVYFKFFAVRLTKSYDSQFLMSLVFDVGFTTALVHFTGGIDSEFYVLYYATISLGALQMGLQRGLIFSLGATTLYSLTVASYASEVPMLILLTRVSAAWLTAAAVGIVANHTRLSEGKLLKLLDTLNVRTTELERTQVQLENIYNTSRKLAAILNLDQLLGEINRIADKLWGYALFEVILIDHETGELKVVASVENGESRILQDPRLVRPKGVVGRVVQTCIPERIVDASTCPYYMEGLIKAKSELAVPMLSHGRAIGVLNAESFSIGTFTERDQKLVSILAASAAMAIENARLHQEVSDLAVIDELTGIHNFRYFSERLVEEKKRSERYNLPLSLIMIDIDWFKETNDNYGHEVGNAVLRELVGVLRECIRDTDRACRYGGEEFIVILPQTGRKDADAIGSRIRERVDGHEFGGYGGIPKMHITVSIGITSYPENNLSVDELISAVDSALYRAKGAGKNMVCSI